MADRTRDVSVFYFPETLENFSPLFFHVYQDGAHKGREDYPKEAKIYFKEDESLLYTISLSEDVSGVKITESTKENFHLKEEILNFFKANRLIFLEYWNEMWMEYELVEESFDWTKDQKELRYLNSLRK